MRSDRHQFDQGHSLTPILPAWMWGAVGILLVAAFVVVVLLVPSQPY